MDPVVVAVFFKGTGTLLAMVFGFLIARYGYLLFRDGAGHGRDRVAIELGSLRLRAHSVGAIVMSTAFLWAWAGVSLSPSIQKVGDDWTVTFPAPADAEESSMFAHDPGDLHAPSPQQHLVEDQGSVEERLARIRARIQEYERMITVPPPSELVPVYGGFGGDIRLSSIENEQERKAVKDVREWMVSRQLLGAARMLTSYASSAADVEIIEEILGILESRQASDE
jgi:hypothetical protein